MFLFKGCVFVSCYIYLHYNDFDLKIFFNYPLTFNNILLYNYNSEQDGDIKMIDCRYNEFIIYLVKTNRGYKIGRTCSLNKRIGSLKLETGGDVELIFSEVFKDVPYALETAFHHHFKEKLVFGREYFDLSNEDIEKIKSKTFHGLLTKKVKTKVMKIRDRHVKNICDPIIHAMHKKQRLFNEINEIDRYLERAFNSDSSKEKFIGENDAINKYLCKNLGISPNF